MMKQSESRETPLYLLSIEDTLDIIKRAHMQTGHGGRGRLLNEL